MVMSVLSDREYRVRWKSRKGSFLARIKVSEFSYLDDKVLIYIEDEERIDNIDGRVEEIVFLVDGVERKFEVEKVITGAGHFTVVGKFK